MSKICNKCGWSSNKEIYCANCGNILNDKNVDVRIDKNNVNNTNNNINLNKTDDGINIDIFRIIKWLGLLIIVIIISIMIRLNLSIFFGLNSPLFATLLIVGITTLITIRIKYPENKIFAKITKYLITFIIAQIIISIVFLVSCYMACKDTSPYDIIPSEGCD